MRRQIHAGLLLFCCAGTAGANTNADEDRLIVNRIDRSAFEVVEMQGLDARAF